MDSQLPPPPGSCPCYDFNSQFTSSLGHLAVVIYVLNSVVLLSNVHNDVKKSKVIHSFNWSGMKADFKDE